MLPHNPSAQSAIVSIRRPIPTPTITLQQRQRLHLLLLLKSDLSPLIINHSPRAVPLRNPALYSQPLSRRLGVDARTILYRRSRTHQYLLLDRLKARNLTINMLDIGMRLCGRDDLRIHAHARKIQFLATQSSESEIEILLTFLEVFDQFYRAGIADGVAGRADRGRDVEQHARAGAVLVVVGDVAEFELAGFGGDGGVVYGVVAAVAVVGAAAVADPDYVPVLAVGGGGQGGAVAGGVVFGLEGPVDYCLDAFGDEGHYVFDAHVPVCVAFDDEGCGDSLGDDSGRGLVFCCYGMFGMDWLTFSRSERGRSGSRARRVDVPDPFPNPVAMNHVLSDGPLPHPGRSG